jgi:putative transposase
MAPVGTVCEAFGISRQAYYVAKKPVDPRPARSGGSHGSLSTADLLARIRAVVAEHVAWGVRKVWAFLRHVKKVVVSRRRVWQVMKAHGLVLPPSGPERREEVLRGTVAVPDSNRRWATDLTTQWTARDGVVAIVPMIDCGDRVVLALEVTKSQEAPAVLRPVDQALEAAFGDPSRVPDGLELRTDHGPQYTGADAEALCERWDLLHTFAPVGRPTGNAVAERFIQTLKVELLWTRDFETLAELREAIEAWLETYHHQRPHQSLGWQTPAERREQNLKPLKRAA